MALKRLAEAEEAAGAAAQRAAAEAAVLKGELAYIEAARGVEQRQVELARAGSGGVGGARCDSPALVPALAHIDDLGEQVGRAKLACFVLFRSAWLCAHMCRSNVGKGAATERPLTPSRTGCACATPQELAGLAADLSNALARVRSSMALRASGRASLGPGAAALLAGSAPAAALAGGGDEHDAVLLAEGQGAGALGVGTA